MDNYPWFHCLKFVKLLKRKRGEYEEPKYRSTKSSTEFSRLYSIDTLKSEVPCYRFPKNVKYYKIIKKIGVGSSGHVMAAKVEIESEVKMVALKRIVKADVINKDQVHHIMNEFDILRKVKHPFVINLYTAFKDTKFLYFAFEYVPGGDLFSYLRKQKRFSYELARFYTAQIISVFEYLHERDIIYRDLKPENILIDADGYIKLADFGFARYVNRGAFTLCGTPEYIAPEVLLGGGHGKGVDWWSFGVLLYELLVGFPPFCSNDPLDIYEKILEGVITFPSWIDRTVCEFISSFLTHDVSKRIGNLHNGIRDIKCHYFYRRIRWDLLVQKKYSALYIPKITSFDDTSNFDEVKVDPQKGQSVSEERDPFSHW